MNRHKAATSFHAAKADFLFLLLVLIVPKFSVAEVINKSSKYISDLPHTVDTNSDPDNICESRELNAEKVQRRKRSIQRLKRVSQNRGMNRFKISKDHKKIEKI